MDALYMYLPKGLDLPQLLEKNPPETKLNIDHIRYVISKLSEIPTYRKSSIDQSNGWVILNSTKIQKVGIRKFSDIKNWLERNGIIEVDQQYIVGKRSRRFRLTKKHQGKIDIQPFDKTLFVQRILEKKRSGVQKLADHKLYTFFEKLLIDSRAALIQVDKEYEKNKTSNHSKAIRKLSSAVVCTHKIHTRCINFQFDTTSKRLHTNLTSLRKDLRNFITYNNESLVAVDINNCQPLLISSLFNKFFWQKIAFLKRLCKDNVSSFTITPVKADINPARLNLDKIQSYLGNNNEYRLAIEHTRTLMLAEFGNVRTLKTEDISKFTKFAKSGRFYENCKEALFDKSQAPTQKLTKADMKPLMFNVLFSRNSTINKPHGHNKRIFKKAFPTVYSIFETIKQINYKVLAILLQSIESYIVFELIVRRISLERPELPIFTIHDSIVTTKGNEEYIQLVMEEEIMKAIGVIPHLSVEYWEPENIDN